MPEYVDVLRNGKLTQEKIYTADDMKSEYERGKSEAVTWISVKDRLPEKHAEYICRYHFCDNEMLFIGTLYWYPYDDDPHWQGASNGLIVDYWMPVPEPPKEDKCPYGNPYLTGYMDYFKLPCLSEGTQAQAKEYAEMEGLI